MDSKPNYSAVYATICWAHHKYVLIDREYGKGIKQNYLRLTVSFWVVARLHTARFKLVLEVATNHNQRIE